MRCVRGSSCDALDNAGDVIAGGAAAILEVKRDGLCRCGVDHHRVGGEELMGGQRRDAVKVDRDPAAILAKKPRAAPVTHVVPSFHAGQS